MQKPSSSKKKEADNENNESPSKNAEVEEKKKLIKQIKELRSIIKQCKWHLQKSYFKDMEKYVTEESSQSLEISSHTLPNVEYDMQTDLYRFAGFWCVKSRKDEFVFNFTSTNKEQKDHTYAVQIFVKDKKGTLGKWVMPMSINMDQLLSKTPIKELNNLMPFVKSCKHNVVCYTVRQEQFLALQKHISQFKYCTLQTDIGFRLISLELFSIHDKENDTYMNLIIYLRYYSDKARPYAIEVDTKDKNKLSDDTKQKLKSWLKKFRMLDLQAAFDNILTDNSIFTWMQTDIESPLELNDTSSSDEGNFVVQLQSARKKSLRKLKKKRNLQKKWSEWKKTKNIRNITLPEDSEEDNHPKAKVPRIESPSQNLMKEKKKTKKAISILKRDKINKNLLVETTPIVKVKLKQTKLNFQTHEIATSSTNKTSLFDSQQSNTNSPNKKQLKVTSNISPSKKLKAAKLVTSTPLCHGISNVAPLSLSNMDNIVESSIEKSEQTTNQMKSFQIKNKLKNKKTKKKT